MRNALLWLIALCIAAGGGVAWSRYRPAPIVTAPLFAPAPFPIQHRPFVLFFSGRNNGAFVEAALQSAFSQRYDRFRVVYVDDASTDGSDYLAETALQGKGTFFRNEAPLGWVANLKRVAAACQPEEILVVPGANDALAHEWVLERLNAYYAQPELWFAYGQAVELPSFARGHASAVEMPYLFSVYAARLQFPLLESCRGHTQFLDEVFTLHNPEERHAKSP